ncbi:MAG: hypothetical protein AAFY78_02840 [Cyanobacteria bacterium J06648_16]
MLAQSEDYALLIKALLDLQQASLVFAPGQAADWLEKTVAIQAEFDQWLRCDLGGYYNTAKDASDSLLIRERSYQDSATPSANGIALCNLVRLALLSENMSYLNAVERSLLLFGSAMEEMPRACPTLFQALDWFQHPTLMRTAVERISPLLKQSLPTAVVAIEENLPEGAIGLVCQGLSCQEPATSEAQLKQQIAASCRA